MPKSDQYLRKYLSHEDLLIKKAEDKEVELERKRQQFAQKELESCSFTPKINSISAKLVARSASKRS